jgi:hypothetical protein
MLNLPLPSADEQRAFRHDADAMRVALKLSADVVQAVQRLEPETLLALALQHCPGETDFQALAKFGLELSAMLRELEEHGEDVRHLAKAERDRLEPLKRAAVKRMWAAVDRLRGIPRIIASSEALAREKRAELKLLGVEDPAALERAAPMPNYSEFDAEKRALEAEIAALEEFLRTGDESLLPPGIEPLEPVKNEAPRAEQKSPLAKLAEEVAGFFVSPAGR